MTVTEGVQDMIEQKDRLTTVAFLGGDRRQCMAAKQLAAAGYQVSVAALPEAEGLFPIFSGQANYVVLPIPGLDAEGRITPNSGEPLQLSAHWVAELAKGTVLLIGRAPAYLRDWCMVAGVTVVDYLEAEAYQIANAVPTAEGAIYLAMTGLRKTLHGARCVVLGLGHCGLALALRLQALGAIVSVAARKASDFALGASLGLQMVAYDHLPEVAAQADCLFNTVPAQVITQPVLTRLSHDCLIIDLASAPGGTDWSLAETLGIKSLPAGNLPGRFFPETAGKLLAEQLLTLIRANDSLSVKIRQGGCEDGFER